MFASYNKVLIKLVKALIPIGKAHDYTILLTLKNHFNNNPVKLGKQVRMPQQKQMALKKNSGLHTIPKKQTLK